MPPRDIPAIIFDADTTKPTTPAQALMEAAPGQDPQKSSIEPHELADVLDELLSELDEQSRDMVVMHVSGLSVREIAEMVGVSKSQVHRKLPELMEQLADKLKNNTEVMAYVQGTRPRDD
jgi:RNA polymerase sigma factor (sigma-70 family)